LNQRTRETGVISRFEDEVETDGVTKSIFEVEGDAEVDDGEDQWPALHGKETVSPTTDWYSTMNAV